MHGKSTLPLGNNLVFSCGKSENANIFGGHPRTGVPTMLIEPGTLKIIYVTIPGELSWVGKIGNLKAKLTAVAHHPGESS